MRRILLIEDNEMNRDMLSRRLARQGFEVETAVDGRQGLDAARISAFDLILMDLSLPGIDGWTVARRLKGDPGTASTPVIALTAHAMSGDRERAIKAGADDYDTKPVDLPRLLDKIEALLARRATSALSDPAGVEAPSQESTRTPDQARPEVSESSIGNRTAAPRRLDR